MTRTFACTGGIACGKSEVARRVRACGIPVLDTDEVAHDLLQPGTPVFQQVVRTFGEVFLNPDGRLDRARLGARVFADPEALSALNRCVHPAVDTTWRAWRDSRPEEWGLVVVPLLYEVGWEDAFDGVLCVRAPREQVLERLRLRGLSREQAELRLRAQWEVEEKAARADWVIDNHGTLDDLQQAVDQWVRRISLQEKPDHVG